MGMPIVDGRGFEPREAAPVVVVNEAFVRAYFPGGDALGARLRFSPRLPAFTIVGIVADAKVRGAREAPRVETFAPYWQFTEPGMNIILKAAGNPAQLAGPLRQAVASIDPNVPVSPVTNLSELVSGSIEQPRFFATLALAFAIVALALAAIGLYGVMAYSVSQRTAEIGVRMALGASPFEVFRLVIGDGLRVTAAGLAVGTIGSFMVARWLAALLFGVGPGEPVVFLSTAALLLLVAAAACLIPARRATRVDPMIALRAE
jgi:predicted permease